MLQICPFGPLIQKHKQLKCEVACLFTKAENANFTKRSVKKKNNCQNTTHTKKKRLFIS